MYKIDPEELEVTCHPKPCGGLEMSVTPTSANAADCLNVVMELNGYSDANNLLEWLVMSTVESVNDKFPTNKTSGTRNASNENIESFALNAIVSRVNEKLSEIKVQ